MSMVEAAVSVMQPWLTRTPQKVLREGDAERRRDMSPTVGTGILDRKCKTQKGLSGRGCLHLLRAFSVGRSAEGQW